ncbi:MAG: nicotinate-nicotinamide nucleotide adenylyltransferase, partial [Acidimicrobiales bacterium]
MPSDTPDPRRYWAGMRLGLLGGTFDPPHLGHLAAARTVRDALGLDRVDLLPANDPWQKSVAGRVVTEASVRLAMVRALVQGEDGLGVDDREIRRGGPTYTADTLEEIHAEMPGMEVHLIIGADTARTFGTWMRPGVVAALSTLVVVNRGDETV